MDNQLVMFAETDTSSAMKEAGRWWMGTIANILVLRADVLAVLVGRGREGDEQMAQYGDWHWNSLPLSLRFDVMKVLVERKWILQDE